MAPGSDDGPFAAGWVGGFVAQEAEVAQVWRPGGFSTCFWGPPDLMHDEGEGGEGCHVCHIVIARRPRSQGFEPRDGASFQTPNWKRPRRAARESL